jgi:uncharacterized radical SAM superfamily Fe-S cluster-containing enzyme
MKKEIFINSTLAYCTNCNQSEITRIVARQDGVFMERMCSEIGVQSTKIAADYNWYMERVVTEQEIETIENPLKSKEGCPKDCGPCEWHTSSLKLPVFSITNDCNMNCPICFTYNRPDKKYYKSNAETEKIIQTIKNRSKNIQLINMTGGEPTCHPNLFEIIQTVKNNGINRITMNTNGLRIAEDFEFAKKIKESGVHLVLSLDTLDKEKSKIIHGVDCTEEKLKALETIEKLNIPITILPVCIKGVNENDVSEIVNKYITKPFVRSITIQNMTFTGENGKEFEPREHITIDEVESLISDEKHIKQNDFFSLGSYHPLCYSAAIYISYKEKLYSLTKIFSKEELFDLTKNSYYLDYQQDFSKKFLDGINNLWASGADEDYIKKLKEIFNIIHPRDKKLTSTEQTKLLEEMIKLVYIHPHMDEDNFDIDRVSRCGDLVPDESGKLVPACAYNLLYRQKDERFWVE